MDPFGMEFGKTIGQLVGEYRTSFAWLALIWHVATLALLYLIFRYGNRYRRLFAAYFALNYVWLVAFVGLWMSVGLYQRMGLVALAWHRDLKYSIEDWMRMACDQRYWLTLATLRLEGLLDRRVVLGHQPLVVVNPLGDAFALEALIYEFLVHRNRSEVHSPVVGF
jgi:hypothetical protein